MQSAGARNNPALIVHKKTATLCDRVAVSVGAYGRRSCRYSSGAEFVHRRRISTIHSDLSPATLSIAATISAGSLTETLTVGCPYLAGLPRFCSLGMIVPTVYAIVPIPGTNAPGKVACPTGQDAIVEAPTIGAQLSHLARHIVSCYLSMNMHGSP